MKTILLYSLAALLGYALGCLNLAWLIGRRKGFDIRSKGSNNAGASNAAITMGMSVGVAVGVHDILKSFLAAFLASMLLPTMPLAPAIAGVAAVLGHIFPFYLRFRGGKGFAPFLGLTLALDWKFFLGIIVVILLVTLITDYIVVGTFTTIASFPVYLFFTQASLIVVGIVCVASMAILIKHRVNIVRLATGREIGLRRTLRKEDKVDRR